MYGKDDPRASLAPASTDTAKRVHKEFFPSQVGLFYEMEPQTTAPGVRTWITRGQNFIIAYSDCEAGVRLDRAGQPDEYVVLLPEADTSVTISAGGESVAVPGFSIAFVPPGDSSVEVTAKGPVYRLFSPKAEDIAALASNASAYGGEHPNVPPFQPWPDPPGGFKIRHYSLDVPQEAGRFGRIFRCTTFMVNYLDARVGPRPPTNVSPHHHDDFEQCSLAVAGTFTHHLRWPWTTDMTKWREDEHLFCASPSVCVIPPPSIHTTTAESDDLNQLVDIFAPPRMDFSQKAGWVLNADDYPMPGA